MERGFILGNYLFEQGKCDNLEIWYLSIEYIYPSSIEFGQKGV